MSRPIRVLSEQETLENLDLIMATPAFHRSPTTPEIIARFRAAGALLCVVLAEQADDRSQLPDWANIPSNINLLIPRAQLICQLFGPQGHGDFMQGKPDAALVPLQPDDPTVYAFPAIVVSTARNGMAKLVIALSERLEAHPAFARLQDLVWYTRTVKGQALNDYFHAENTGLTLKRTRPNEAEQTMPIYRLHFDNWRAQLDVMVGKLLGFEDQFTDELTQLHLKLRGQRV